jgi:isoleucyl-tRNA synthetase
VVEAGRAARESAGIKVRQPLLGATLAEAPFEPELESIVRDELNLKALAYTTLDGAPRVTLDTTLTPELKREGLARELVRKIQELRRQAGLRVEDRITLWYEGQGELVEALEAWTDYVAAETLAVRLQRGPSARAHGEESRIGPLRIWLGVEWNPP